MVHKQKGFLLLDVLSACALISIILLSTISASRHFDTTLKINKVRVAAEIFAQDLRKLQRDTMFKCSGAGLTIKITNGSVYSFYEGLSMKKSVSLDDLGCEGVYFNKVVKNAGFSYSGAPSASGDFELKHRDLNNFSCKLSLQPVTGRVVISEDE